MTDITKSLESRRPHILSRFGSYALAVSAAVLFLLLSLVIAATQSAVP